MQSRTRGRLQLLLVAGLFAAPLLIAMGLNIVGWQPRGTRNFGELLSPAQDVRGIQVQRADGAPFAWTDANWQWTLVAESIGPCATDCLAQLDLLHRARLTLNQNADRVRLAYLGPPLPSDVIAQLRPLVILDATRGANILADATPGTAATTPPGLNAGLVDPNGFLMLRYTAGFDANGLKKDLARLIH